MKIKITILLLVFTWSITSKAQKVSFELKRRKQQIEFLVIQKEFEDTKDNFISYKKYIYERTVYEKRNLSVDYRIFIFGATSNHSKNYICLTTSKSIRFLESKDFNTDLIEIISFIHLSSPDFSATKLLNLFEDISLCYAENNKTSNHGF
ncbi:hypothetical protein [Nubsella zeaxanthinifaciens]|jgi:hypothetical protein|uniref:hypothetical protein n=1 Tax=Nubsella zeaxanthinifaciens TaxID=392412 RepID=UPI000DE28086|nr:hypothetical protein [Nubsella zeaxanthinifaciens]